MNNQKSNSNRSMASKLKMIAAVSGLSLLMVPFINMSPLSDGRVIEPIVNLTFGEGYVIDKSKFQTWNGKGNLYFDLSYPLPNGIRQSHRMVAEPGSNFAADLVHDRALDRNSIRLQLAPYQDGCVSKPKDLQCKAAHRKDKVQLSVIGFRDEKSLRIDNQKTRFVSYDFKLDKNYELGKTGPAPWVLHFQVWQCCVTPPPFSVVVEPAAPGMDPKVADVNLVFLVRDDVSTGFGQYKKNVDACKQDKNKCGFDKPFYTWGKEVYRMKMPRDKWGKFTFELKPSYNGDGKAGLITFWYDGEQKFKYVGDWGYGNNVNSPLQQFYISTMEDYLKKGIPAEWTEKDFFRLMSIELDIYRGPFQAETQAVEFSNVRYGDTLSSVAP